MLLAIVAAHKKLSKTNLNFKNRKLNLADR